MKNLLIALLVLLALSGCASTSQPETHFDIAVSNFVYERDIENEYRIYDSIHESFYGDCEDFAFTLQIQIGGQVWYTVLPGEGAHAVLVKDGVAYDFLMGEMPVNEYPSKMLYWFDSVGNWGVN